MSSLTKVCFSHLVKYAIACSGFQDFLVRLQLLILNFLSQGYVKPSLEASLEKFSGRQRVYDVYQMQSRR